MTCLSHLGFFGGHSFDETAALSEQSSARYWQLWQAHTVSRFAFDVQNSVRVRLNNQIMQ
jgi:hypothetical protein